MILLQFFLKLFFSLIIYTIIYKAIEALTVVVIRTGTYVGRLLRPINKRGHETKVSLITSDFLPAFAWLILAISLMLLFPICLLLFTFNVYPWKQLAIVAGLSTSISLILFFLDTTLFYNDPDETDETVELGVDWVMYFYNMPLIFKQNGFASTYYK